ncbi:MAG: hypothetical protein K2Q24_00710 [Chitinophagaceae bacterium]|nr:hypothetical protein [Chitinophagaceae bacterium]
MGSTIHDGNIPLLFEYPSGNAIDGSIRYTTAGFQTVFSFGYDFIKSDKNSLLFKIGVPLRYQSSSYYDNVIILYEPITSLPFPVIIFNNRTPQKTLAIGLSPQIAYNFIISNKIVIGLSGSFQFDTNGDNISSLSFTIGHRF